MHLGLSASLAHIAAAGKGVAVLLVQRRRHPTCWRRSTAPPVRAGSRTWPHGPAQLWRWGAVLRECGVQKMQLLGAPRRMPSMASRVTASRSSATSPRKAHRMLEANKGATGPLDGTGLRIGINAGAIQRGHHGRAGDGLPGRTSSRRVADGLHRPSSRSRRTGGADHALQALAERGGYQAR